MYNTMCRYLYSLETYLHICTCKSRCMFFFQALASLHESFQPFLEQVLENREEWEQEVKVGMKEIKNTDNSEGKQKQRKSDKKAKEDKKQLKKGSTVAKKQTKKAKKNRKKITKAKKSSSTEQGHVGTSYIGE